MDQARLGSTMKSICRYFGKPEPKADTLSEWMKDLIHIPNEPMPWIETKIKANKYPDNPPQAIRKLWFIWLEEHPEKSIKPQGGCPECNRGWIFAHINGHSGVFRCGTCNKFDGPGIARTRFEIIQSGYELDWSHFPPDEIRQLPNYKKGLRLISGGIRKMLDNQFKLPYRDEVPF